MQKVTCDHCGKKFNIKKTKKRLVGEVVGEKVTAVYFQCPKCKVEYIAHYETSKIVELINENRTLQSTALSAMNIKDFAKREECNKQIAKNMHILYVLNSRIKTSLMNKAV